MILQKQGERAKYQERQGRRGKEALTLSQEFPRLKFLKVSIRYLDSDAPDNSHPLKFAVNIQHAKAVLRFHCLNAECIRGDFDLTGELAEAVKRHCATVTGEMLVMPANEPHALKAADRLKMMLVMIRS